MKRLFVLVAAFLFLCACSSTHNDEASSPGVSSAPVSLVGTEWVLREVAGTPALPTPQATIAFPEAGRVAGSGSCNRFTGSVEISGSALKFGQLASTRMACMDDGVSQQEDHYLKALAAAMRYTVENGDLLIYCEGSEKPLRFTRSRAAKP